MSRSSEFPVLMNDCIHLWIVRIQASDDDLMDCASMLSPSEIDRAERFRFANLRNAYLLKHACLRILLGRYLDMAAKDVSFAIGRSGKPRIEGRGRRVTFNLSDSGDLAAIAVSLDCELGVDIEGERSVPEWLALAARYFSQEETRDILALPEASRRQAFFLTWTRKEAFVKAVGDGLLIPLDSFRVTSRPDDVPAIVHIGGDRAAGRQWTMHDFRPAAGYCGAIAHRGKPMALHVQETVTTVELLGRWRAQ